MRKRERLAGSKAYRLRFEAEKPKPLPKLRHTESAADALSDLLADAVLPADETEEKENVGVQAVRTGRQGAEFSVRRMSKQRQKKQIQRQYAAAQSGRQAEGITVQGAGSRYDNAANTARLGGYATTDLRLEYAFHRDWSLLARASNVFDREYETVAWYYQPGREYHVALRWRPAR